MKRMRRWISACTCSGPSKGGCTFSSLAAAFFGTSFSVPVAPGQDGAFWRFEQCAGDRYLMTIPPYLAAHPSKLLLPAEVVARDAAQPAALPAEAAAPAEAGAGE